MPASADADFARYARTRDPAALAAVFDHTAANLLLVAMHLTADAADAEDLVQVVFLQAIRDAGSYDRDQPVLPWLLGILEHRASDLRRRAHRHRERPAVADAQAPEHDAPDRTAASAELLHQIAAALDTLPATYREVLTLRLVHGLRAVDIAHAQSASPETVRTRLRRGLELLRRVLPKGLAGPGLVALLTGESLRAGRGLASVKQNLLRALPAGAVAAIGGAVLTKWLAGAVAVAAASVLWVALMLPETSAPAPAGPPGAVAPVVADGGAHREQRDVGFSPATLPVNRREVPVPPAATDATVIRGRILAAETGAPLAGATLHLRTWSSDASGILSEELPADWLAPPDLETGPDGRFAMRFVPRQQLVFDLQLGAAGRVGREKHWSALRTGIAVDVGDWPLQLGTPLQIRVVAAPERPCQGLEVEVHPYPQAKDAVHFYMDLGRTDANGVAAASKLCRPGLWRYRIRTALDGGEGELELPLQTATFSHTVVLRRPPPELTVSGTVVATGGAPVADLTLELSGMSGDRWTAGTGQAGAFLFARPSAPEGKSQRFTLRLPPERVDLELVDDGGELGWGTNDLKLIVRRRLPASLTLAVVDGGSGAAVEHFGASCRHDLTISRFRVVPAEHHERGVVRFDGLAPGVQRVSLFPGAPLADALELRFELREGEAKSERVELLPPAGLQVLVVVAATQRPLAGVDVSLARVLPETDVAKVTLTNSSRFPRYDRAWSGGPHVITLDQAVTDAGGKATLRATRATPALVVIVEGERCVARMVKDVTLAEDRSGLRIEVEAAAVLRGTVRPGALLQRFGPTAAHIARATEEERVSGSPAHFTYGQVKLRPPGTGRTTHFAPITADGGFQFESLAAARYEVWLGMSVPDLLGVCDLDLGLLATVELRGGDVRQLDLDASAWLPGRATGRFFIDGVPWQGTAGFARRKGDIVLPIMADADAAGRATSPWLLPGTYVPFVDLGDGRESRFVFGTVPFVVAAGADAAITADLHRRRVTVTLLDADGKPVANRTLAPEPIDHPWAAYCGGSRTDGRGVATWDPAPPGRLRVHAIAPEPTALMRDQVLGEVAAEASELTVRPPR